MKFSSSFKVGLLTIIALAILVMSILWIKGRALSAGERITINFHDANGIRSGASVQMMGLRIGQIEEVTPHIENDNSYVSVKFVITEPNIKILDASEISIQTTGVIGEQFLEITPPRTKYIYVPLNKSSKVLDLKAPVNMLLSEKIHKIGFVKTINVVDTKTLPLDLQDTVKTPYAYKIGYVITLPGLVLPEFITAKITTSDNTTGLRIYTNNGVKIEYPKTNSKYTIIEPMRWAEFVNIQYRAAASLAETNERVSMLLSDDVIVSLKSSIDNINTLTKRANTTLEKAELLIDSSKADIENILANVNIISDKFVKLTDDLNKITGDKDFQKSVVSTTKSLDRLAKNLNCVLEDTNTKALIANLNATSKNIAEISSYVNDITKDEKLKTDIVTTLNKFDKALDEFNTALETVNSSIGPEQKEEIKQVIDDASKTSANVKKFSEKLNKRFLLFRLMF